MHFFSNNFLLSIIIIDLQMILINRSRSRFSSGKHFYYHDESSGNEFNFSSTDFLLVHRPSRFLMFARELDNATSLSDQLTFNTTRTLRQY